MGFLEVRKRFDFRSVEIGRWVTEAEKQRSAVLFYDALCDLMIILGGTEALISLRGSLALQYGIGGRPRVAAHYTPSTRSFSLAKNAGLGCIAHEWFHAFDHYISDKLFVSACTQSSSGHSADPVISAPSAGSQIILLWRTRLMTCYKPATGPSCWMWRAVSPVICFVSR